jgi:hypothetical protein
MAKTIQRLSDINALRRFNIVSGRDVDLSDVIANNDWYAAGSTPISIVPSNFFVSHYYTMEIDPITEGPVTVYLPIDDIFDEFDLGGTFVFTGVIYAPEGNLLTGTFAESINVTAALYNADTGVVEGNTRSIQSGTWFAFRSNQMTLDTVPDGDNTSYMVALTITGHKGLQIKMSTPNVVNDNVWALNPVISNLRSRLPDFYFDYDGLETDPQYPFLRLIDVFTETIADSMQAYSDWFKYDTEEIPLGVERDSYTAQSVLVDPKYIRAEYLQWAFQFAGVPQVKQLTVAGNVEIPATNEDYKIAQLSPAIYGRGAGTQSAIRTAVKFVLTGSKTVVISQRAGGDTWVIKLTTLTSESPSSEVILAAAEEARPVGFTIIHQAVSDFNFILGDPIYGRLGSGRL